MFYSRTVTRTAAIALLVWFGVLGVGCTDATGDSARDSASTAESQSAESLQARVSQGSDSALEPAIEHLIEEGSVRTPATILVVGDSISAAYGIQREQGWVALLETQLKRLGSEHRVINASISGDTTGGGLARLPDALATHEPDLVILELGGNDGLRGYPIQRLRANLEGMIEASLAANAQVLLLGMQIPPNYGPRYTLSFAATFEDLASEYDLTLVPSFLEDVALAGNLMQSDGIHPKASAQPLLLQRVWPAIVEFLRSHR